MNALISRLCDPGQAGIHLRPIQFRLQRRGRRRVPRWGPWSRLRAGYPFVFFAASGILMATGLIVVRASAHGITFGSGSRPGVPEVRPAPGGGDSEGS
ncbi:MAG: hypothetical protein MZV70_22175 [Desulfobacterales bacterium]|nr:hypothetical protein [Desulfobacterales bacterium]